MSRSRLISRVVIGLVGAMALGSIVASSATASPALYSRSAVIPVGQNPTLIEPCNNEIYVSNFNSGTLSVIDPATNLETRTITVGTNPYGLTCDAGLIYVVNYSDNTVSIVNTSTHTVVATVNVGAGPSDVVVANGYAYVSGQSDGSVKLINTSTRVVDHTLSVGGFPVGMAVANGKVFVTNQHPSIPSAVIDATTQAVTSLSVPSVTSWAAVTQGYVYFTEAGGGSGTRIFKVDATNLSVTTLMSLPTGPTSIAAEGTIAYVTSYGANKLYAVDLASATATAISVDANPSGVTTYGSHAYVSHQGTHNVWAIVISAPSTAQTITFENPGTQVMGSALTLTATATSGLPVMFTSSTPSVCTTTSAGSVTFVSDGTCTVNADQAGDSTYVAATTVTQSFTVDPEPTAPSTPPAGTENPPATPDASGTTTTLPPAPAAFRVIKGRVGAKSTVEVLQQSDAAGTAVRSTVVVVLDRKGKVVSRISVSVKTGDSVINVEVPYVAAGYTVHVYNVNDAGVSTGAIPGSSAKREITVLSHDGPGAPSLIGSPIAKPVTFGAKSAKLDARDRRQLRNVARIANAGSAPLYITGFAVARGEKSNVSTARARAVADFLSGEGVRVWMRYWGVGKVKGNSSAAGRRVEIRAISAGLQSEGLRRTEF